MSDVIIKNIISEKVLSFGIQVHTRFQPHLGRELLGIGFGAHLNNNCLKTAADKLPVYFELMLTKLFKYFHTYTVRIAQLKEFCD